MSSQNLCTQCNKELQPKAAFCAQCGCAVASSEMRSEKSAVAALLLCLFLGAFGIHRFYVGKIKTGILMLITGGGLGIWVLVDLILIACCDFKDRDGKYLIFTKGKASPFKLVMLIIGSAVAAFIVYVVLLVTLVIYLTSPMTQAIQNQLAALRHGDIEKAYTYLASETTSTVSLENFKNYIARYPVLTQNTTASFPERKFENDKGYAKGTVESADGKKAVVEYLLAKENNQWKIVAIRVVEQSAATSKNSDGTLGYNDPTDHYSINYPGDWEYDQPNQASVAFSGKEGTPSYYSSVTIQMIPAKGKGGEYEDADAAIDDLKDQISSKTKNAKISDTSEMELPTNTDITGGSFIATYSYKGHSMKKMQVVLSGGKDGMIYSWSYVAPVEQYEHDLPIAKAMYESWKIK